MDKLLKLLGTLVLIGLLGVSGWHWLINVPEQRKARNAMLNAEAKARFDRWAYIAREKEIAPGETIRLVVIPDPNGIDFLDTKCLIYTHKEYRTSAFQCPNDIQYNLEE